MRKIQPQIIKTFSVKEFLEQFTKVKAPPAFRKKRGGETVFLAYGANSFVRMNFFIYKLIKNNKKSCAGCHSPIELSLIDTSGGLKIMTILKKTHRPVTVDHIFPKTWGGGNDQWNLQLMCVTCNNKKGDTIELKKTAKLFDQHKEYLDTIINNHVNRFNYRAQLFDGGFSLFKFSCLINKVKLVGIKEKFKNDLDGVNIYNHLSKIKQFQ